MRRAFLFYVVSIFILSFLMMESTVYGKFHSNKKAMILTKKHVPYDFIPSDLMVLSIGDSLTKGIGDSTKRGGYIPYLQTKLEKEKGINEVEFLNYGVKGNQSKDLLIRLETKELQNAIKKSDMVILTIGGNDIMKVVKENISHLRKKDFIAAQVQYEKNLNGIFASIRSIHPNIPIILISLYNPFYTWFADVEEMDEILDSWNETGKQVVTSNHDTYFVRIDDIFKNTNKDILYKDYFHPNDNGYSLIANRLHKIMINKAIKDLTQKQYTASKEEKK